LHDKRVKLVDAAHATSYRRAGASPQAGVRLSNGLGIAGGDDCGCFYHKNYCPFRGSRAMNDALRDNKPLLLTELDASILEIDDETTFQDKEELVVVVVFVPVILALHDAETNDRIVHLAQRLVVPAVRASRDQRWHVHQL
jgi:hypothetical protein